MTQTSPDVAACVYFICSEALANVAKHASASAVRLSVTARADMITVEVADDGAGGANPQGGGIRGLADRVETLGGTLTVASAPGQGTRLTAVLPDGTGDADLAGRGGVRIFPLLGGTGERGQARVGVDRPGLGHRAGRRGHGRGGR